MHRRIVWFLPVVLVTVLPLQGDEISFSTQIRPILSDKCFQCHGPDEAQRQAGLRLDVEASAKAPLESDVTAIVPGDLTASALIERITSDDPDLRMPPADSGKSLTPQETELLRRWVESGAAWGGHWAFDRVVRPALPADDQVTGPSNNPIDRFIGRRLQQVGLTPNSPADRVTLLRRVWLDIVGLPPTPAVIDAFLADGRPDAYERVVDRLLEMPEHGEHMARFWLDAARYGDTHGLHLDNYREMWAYRDWVISAFNRNLPFDQFVIEQLAGDLLENPTDDQLIATGFNRCHVTTSEGGSIAEEVEMRNTVDRVVTTGTVFLGLTLDCTRCHDHKFDPLTMRDFYSLYAFFNSIDGGPLDGNRKDHAPVMKVLTEEQQQEITALHEQTASLRQQISGLVASAAFAEPESPTPPVLAEPKEYVWIDDAVPAGAKPEGNSAWEFVKAPAPVFSGEASHKRTATGLSQHFFTGASQPLRVAEGDKLFCHVWLDPENPPAEIMLQWNDGGWDHRAYWGADRIDWGQKDSPGRYAMGALPKAGEWVRLEVPASNVGLAPGSEINGWAFTQFDGTVYWDRAGIVSATSQQPLYDSFALWLHDQRTAGGMSLPEHIRNAMGAPGTELSPENHSLLQDWFLEHSWIGLRDTIAPLEKQIADAEQREKSIRENAATTQIFRELAEPKPAFILNRGEYDQPRDAVPRQVPAAMSLMPEGAPMNRLGLAQWLTSDEQPLTSRVTVNRLWQQFFGTGLVRTAEDFGSQGEPPSHGLLLDWLASEFMDPKEAGAVHRWDVRHIVRLIVCSAAYRRSAQVTPEMLQRDPANRLLARGPRARLDAETLRDQALDISGLLVRQIGGPSVKPPQPDGLWFAVGYSGSNTVRFKKDEGPEKVHRRSLYTFLKRTAPAPQMSTLDAPSRESCIVRRERTNSPMQALLLLNDPQYVECARGLATRCLKEGGATDVERAEWMLRQVVLRHPLRDEVAGLVSDQADYLAEFRAAPEQAAALIAIGELPPDPGLDPADLAAWTLVANTLMNLDEFLNK